MAKQITPFSLNSPGYYGINTQDSPSALPPEFALEAMNCVIDKAGRIGARKGWAQMCNTNVNLGVANITCIGEVIQNEGTATLVATGNGYLFKHSGSTLTTLTYGGGGAVPSIFADNWQFDQINGIGVFFQRGYDPLIFDPVVSTTTFRRLNEKSGAAGTSQQANCVLSAYGRLWCADTATNKNTVYFSDLLTPHIWTGGTSGSLDLLGVWPQGGDEIVALAAHNNFLVIFGKRQTLIYSNANSPADMVLTDTLSNTGCVARDSVQNTGEDIIFLSDTGVRSLLRTIQEKSAPLRGLSRNVYNDLQEHLAQETYANIKSGYSLSDAFYVLNLPTSSITYCFDTRSTLQDGSSRVTTWNGINPACMYRGINGSFYIGKSGTIGLYSTYLDDDTAYRMSYSSPWLDFGNPIQTSILKKIFCTIVGGVNQDIVLKWGADYVSGLGYQSRTITNSTVIAEYGIAEYGIAEFNFNSYYVDKISVNAGSAGQVIQVGFEADIDTKHLSLQKIDIYTKDGRLS